ncbi:MAG: hypothetical protein HQ517_12505 [SAR324 cluster bacterium]|nr:hypothetical protein [SAR324 cluster bacterium]
MWDKRGGIQRLNIGIKYCGGCNPKYNRVALLDRIKQALLDTWEFVSWEDPAADHILIVAGCDTACVETEPFTGKTLHLLSSEEKSEQTIATLLEIHPRNR